MHVVEKLSFVFDKSEMSTASDCDVVFVFDQHNLIACGSYIILFDWSQQNESTWEPSVHHSCKDC